MLRALAVVGEAEIIHPIFLGPYKVETKRALLRRGLLEQAGFAVWITHAGRRWLSEQPRRSTA